MDTHRFDESAPVRADGLSRRTALRTGAAGLAAVLTATSLKRSRAAIAQEASPTPTYAVGVTAEVLSRKEADAAPGYYLQVVRITFAPEAIVAPHTHSGCSGVSALSPPR